MQHPDATTNAAACLARISALETERMAALLSEAKPAECARMRTIVKQQEVDALAFATRTTP